MHPNSVFLAFQRALTNSSVRVQQLSIERQNDFKTLVTSQAQYIFQPHQTDPS